MSEAYNQGKKARFGGSGKCPYKYATPEYKQWWAGFDQATFEANEQGYNYSY